MLKSIILKVFTLPLTMSKVIILDVYVYVLVNIYYLILLTR